MEFLVEASEEFMVGQRYEYLYQFASYNYPGLDIIPGKSLPIGTGIQYPRLCNLSNQPIPDVRYLTGGNIALSQPDGSWHQLVHSIKTNYFTENISLIKVPFHDFVFCFSNT